VKLPSTQLHTTCSAARVRRCMPDEMRCTSSVTGHKHSGYPVMWPREEAHVACKKWTVGGQRQIVRSAFMQITCMRNNQ
jgi:hypothetical protein